MLCDDDYVTLAQPKLQIPKVFVDAQKKKKARVNKSDRRGREESKLMSLAKCSDVDMEDLQLAIALSKSLEPELVAIQEDEEDADSAQQLKQHLQRFRITSNKPVTTSKRTQNVRGNNKKSRFRYIKSVLHTRSASDRAKIITEKIEHIVKTSNIPTRENPTESTESIPPISYIFHESFDPSAKYFSMSSRNLDDNQYNVESLQLERSRCKCGSMLKDWRLIAGRDISPVRDAIAKVSDKSLTRKRTALRSSSPDLFGSSDDDVDVVDDEIVLGDSLKEQMRQLNNSKTGNSNWPVMNNLQLASASFMSHVNAQLNESDDDMDALRCNALETCDENIVAVSQNGICSYESFTEACDDDRDQSGSELNATDYVYGLLNSNAVTNTSEHQAANTDYIDLSQDEDDVECEPSSRKLTRYVSNVSSASSTNESVCITDEELNYSCMHTNEINVDETVELTPYKHKSLILSASKKKKSKFEISDDEADAITSPLDLSAAQVSVEKILEIFRVHSNKQVNTNESNDTENVNKCDDKVIELDDEEDVYASQMQEAIHLSQIEAENRMLNQFESEAQQSPVAKEPDEFDLLVADLSNSDAFKRPQHPRIQQLINTNISKSPSTKSTPNLTAFDDSFANLLEQTAVLKRIDNIATPPSQSMNKMPTSGTACAGTPATPEDGILIKTVNITPMPLYDAMTTPEIHEALDAIGVKPLKRQRGVQMLRHVYNATHVDLDAPPNDPPLVIDAEENQRPNKRRKKLFNIDEEPQTDHQVNIEIREGISESECDEHLIFERRFSKRIASCALPLHIAWHNFLCTNHDIWESVLQYEPIQVEVIYAMFKDLGFRYNIQDMITFFDRKCITIRINQN